MKLPKIKNNNIVVQQMDREILIYDLAVDKAYCLNETSASVYQNCDGETTFEELQTRYKLTDDLIFFALDQLRKANLLDEKASYRTPFVNMSRREVIRRAGAASLVALPVISSLVAPTAASAASMFVPGSRTLRQSCTDSTDCAAGAPNCTNTPQGSGQHICCVGDDSRFDTGGVVNSCSGGGCSIVTFSCQADAGNFCCSGSATVNCVGNSCQCSCT